MQQILTLALTLTLTFTSMHLPSSPYISQDVQQTVLDLKISPYISLYLPCISLITLSQDVQQTVLDLKISPYISLYLPCISLITLSQDVQQTVLDLDLKKRLDARHMPEACAQP